MRIPKINSINYGGPWIAASLIVGAVIPLILWRFSKGISIVFMCVGGIALLAFFVLLAIESHQDNSKIPYCEKSLKDEIKYDPETTYPVIRASICTGEKVAGFKNKKDGHFTEVMYIRFPDDEKRFKEMYGLDHVKVEY